jgi:hypothetical protein
MLIDVARYDRRQAARAHRLEKVGEQRARCCIRFSRSQETLGIAIETLRRHLGKGRCCS